MARFELATSSLPRRHTARLCHIGIVRTNPPQKSLPGTRYAGKATGAGCLNTLQVFPIKYCGTQKEENAISSKKERSALVQTVFLVKRIYDPCFGQDAIYTGLECDPLQ